MEYIYNKNIISIKEIPSPYQIISEYPSNNNITNLILNTRTDIQNILNKKDKRLIAIIGPCSIHDEKSALEYAEKLSELSKSLNNLVILMRVYFEKPRTIIGWKGLINDPDLNGENNIKKGLKISRKLLIDINNIGLPVASEILDTISPQYISDLISWGAIGARTTESQVHRQLVSGLSMPIGFKNSTNGDINIALDAIIAARNKHTFMGITHEGIAAVINTNGNEDCHIILRGGIEPNYDETNINKVINKCNDKNERCNIIIDCSHGNSKKNYKNQKYVVDSVCNQIQYNDNIIGVMIESHLKEGKQIFNSNKDKLEYGVSITDSCVGFEETTNMLIKLNYSVNKRITSCTPNNPHMVHMFNRKSCS